MESTVRGRDAEHPGKIPARGWMDILWRSWQEVSDANLFLVAGGVTYALLLALFPGLAALGAIYGLVLDPAQVEKQVSNLSGVLPDQSQQLLVDELHKLASASNGTLGVSAVIGLVLALWKRLARESIRISGVVTPRPAQRQHRCRWQGRDTSARREAAAYRRGRVFASATADAPRAGSIASADAWQSVC